MILTAELVANYHRDGYLLVPDLFNSREVGAMIAEVEGGGRVNAMARGNEDASGKRAFCSRFCLLIFGETIAWHERLLPGDHQKVRV